MHVQYFTGTNNPEEYYQAVRAGTTVFEDQNVTVVSKLNGPTIKIIIIDDNEREGDDDPWYCFMELPPDLYLAFFKVIVEEMSLARAISTKLPWMLEGLVMNIDTKNASINYTMPREKAVDLFGEDWLQYLRN